VKLSVGTIARSPSQDRHRKIAIANQRPCVHALSLNAAFDRNDHNLTIKYSATGGLLCGNMKDLYVRLRISIVTELRACST
jgi:hypothetical protein